MNIAVFQDDTALKRLGRRVESFDTIDSTQNVAHHRARAGEPEGSIYLAESQTKGRGRHGRTWHSPSGKNILVSILLRPPVSPRSVQILTFAAAVGVCEGLAEAGTARARIKWPNDITVSGRKLAGILTESHCIGDRLDHVVLGIGLNVNMTPDDWPPDLSSGATSLLIETGTSHSRERILLYLLRGIDGWYDRFLQEGPSPVLAAWRDLSDTLGRDVRVEMKDAVITGRAVGVDETGALRVRLDDGQWIELISGEVVHLR